MSQWEARAGLKGEVRKSACLLPVGSPQQVRDVGANVLSLRLNLFFMTPLSFSGDLSPCPPSSRNGNDLAKAGPGSLSSFLTPTLTLSISLSFVTNTPGISLVFRKPSVSHGDPDR